MTSLLDLTGRTALVTGATRGIGLQTARSFREHGAWVVGHGSSPRSIEAADIKAANTWIAQDLAVVGAGRAIGARLSEIGADIDIVVLNAAMQIRESAAGISDENFTQQINVNLRANMELLQVLLPAMAGRGWGRVITIGSIQQVRPNPQLAVYSSSKSALRTIALAMTRPYFDQGITANNIAAGLIDTERNADIKADPASYAGIVARIPARMAGEAIDIAGAVLFLASDAGRYVIGADLPVDGGAHIPS